MSDELDEGPRVDHSPGTAKWQEAFVFGSQASFT